MFNPEHLKKLEKYTLTAVAAALHAGRDIMEVYLKDDDSFEVTAKDDSSPLTAADTAAHRRIVSYLEPTAIPVLSEEGAHTPYSERKGWDELWIVDPLDGTKEFIKRNGEFTVNIAFVEKGSPVLGVVYAPVLRRLYFGNGDIGSYRCDVDCGDTSFETMAELISLSTRLPVETGREVFTVVASKSHRNPETDEFIAALEKRHGRVDVVSRGSSLKICLVAEGTADVYPRLGPTMEWDTAAGHAVAVFAGASIFDPGTGRAPVYNKENLLNPFFIVERESGSSF